MPCLRHGRRVNRIWTKPPPYVLAVQIAPGGDLVSCSDDTPQARVEPLALQVALRPGLEIAPGVLPRIRKRFLLGRVERLRVALRLERGDAQPLGPSRHRRRCSELDAHLAKDAHSAIADRFEASGRRRHRARTRRCGSCVRRGPPHHARTRSRAASRSRARARRDVHSPRRARARLGRERRRSRRRGRRRERHACSARGRGRTTRPRDPLARTRSRPAGRATTRARRRPRSRRPHPLGRLGRRTGSPRRSHTTAPHAPHNAPFPRLGSREWMCALEAISDRSAVRALHLAAFGDHHIPVVGKPRRRVARRCSARRRAFARRGRTRPDRRTRDVQPEPARRAEALAPGAGAEPDRRRSGAPETRGRNGADPPRPRAAERTRCATRLLGRAAGSITRASGSSQALAARVQEAVVANPRRSVPSAPTPCLRALDDGHARI